MIRPDGTASDAILSTLTPADRIPSIGTQLTIGDPEPEPVRPPLQTWSAMRAERERQPVPLNLWDTSADSIPETWSTPR